MKLFICSSVILISGLLTPGFADEHFPYLAQVSRESVNVRSGPNTNFAKVDQLKKGEQVVVLGRNYEWLRVQPLPTTKAFIRSDYLKPREGSDLAVVLGDNVNVRSLPNSDSSSLGQVKEGTVVKVLVRVNGWSGLAPVSGTAVWVHQDFLKEVSPFVPASLLIPVIPASAGPEVPMIKPSQVSPWVSMRGKLEALVEPPRPDIHYAIVLDDRSIFLLEDIPHIADFCNAVVNVEGSIVPSTVDSAQSSKRSIHPVLRINKITLVL